MHAATVHALDSELKSLAADERRGLVQFLRRLDLLDREGGFELFKCTSAFEYLVKEHHLAEGTAWRRVNAMRLIRRFPQLEAALEDGRLNPTQLGILGPVLTLKNVDEVVRAATRLTKRQTEELAVTIVPRKVPAPGLRKLPAPRAARLGLELEPLSPVMGLTTLQPTPGRGPSPDRTAAATGGPTTHAPVTALPATQVMASPVTAVPRAVGIAPVSKGEWQWRVRMDEGRMAKLERLEGMLAHVIPNGDLERIFDQMLDDSLALQGKKRGFVEPSRPPRPAPAKPATPGERAPVSRAVRAEVLKRDGYRCTWTHSDGTRCAATSRLEMDHLEPARETGSSGAEDLTTRCRFHNQLRARRRYGRAYVAERIDEARRARDAKRAVRTITGDGAQDLGWPDGVESAAGAA
jgi:hypothetical protein